MTLTTERLREIAEDGFLEHGDAKLMARELLDNREAQPVAFPEAKDKSQGWKIDPEYLHAIADAVGSSDDEGAPSMELVEAVLLAAAPPAPAGEVVVTRNERGDIVAVTRQDGEGRVIEVIAESNAPPAPAVPGIDELRLTFERSERESDDGFNLHKYGIGYADEATQARWESWLACRAAMLNHVSEANEKAAEKCECSSIDYCENCLRAMLAEPVSSGYKLPEGWKLVPVEPTAEMINAALASGALSIRTVYRVMLAAAPGGGNDHDTRR